MGARWMEGRPALSNFDFLMWCLLLISKAILFCLSGSFSKMSFQLTSHEAFPYATQDIKWSIFSSIMLHMTQRLSEYFHSFHAFTKFELQKWSYKIWFTKFEFQNLSYKIWVTKHELQNLSYKIWVTKFEIQNLSYKISVINFSKKISVTKFQSQNFSHSVIQSFSHSVTQSLSHSVPQSLSHSVTQSFNFQILFFTVHFHCGQQLHVRVLQSNYLK